MAEMKTYSVLILTLGSLLITSCSMTGGRWGATRLHPNVKLVEHRVETLNGKQYAVNRYLVNANTGETFTETLEILDSQTTSGSSMDSGSGATSTGITPFMVGRVDVAEPQGF
jgi:hypothetical protein